MQLLCSCAVGFLSCAVCSWILSISVQLYFKIPIAVKNCSNYPPPPPVEFTELYRLPPSKSPEKSAPTTPPPVEFAELYRLPSPPRSKSPEKSAPTTPLEFTELYRLLPLPNIPQWNSPDFVQLEKILRITPAASMNLVQSSQILSISLSF